MSSLNNQASETVFPAKAYAIPPASMDEEMVLRYLLIGFYAMNSYCIEDSIFSIKYNYTINHSHYLLFTPLF